MPSLALTLAIFAIWMVQGTGFVHLFVPTTTRPLLRIVFAAWSGLIANLLVSVTLYCTLPGVTIGQLAWPVTLVLSVTSLALHVRRPPSLRFAVDPQAIFIALAVLIAVVLVLRPLVDQSHLGYFESFNGEFTNYAAMADAAQFHDATFDTGKFGMQSREGVAGVALATMSVITHQSALWLVESYSAALAALAFAGLGCVFQKLVSRRQAGNLVALIVGLVFLSWIWSAGVTFFWTASFVSQFLSIAMWVPTLLLLCERTEDDRVITVVLGVVLGAQLIVYWEMFVPNVALLGAFQLARARRGARLRAISTGALALAIGLVVANRFAFNYLFRSTSVSTAGWDMYGPHRTVMRFASNLLGFTSAYHEPAPVSQVMVVAVLVALAGAVVYGAIRAWRETDLVVRGLLHLGWLLLVGVALMFALIIKRGSTNYAATKLLLGYGWLAYVVLALATIDLARWLARRRMTLMLFPALFAILFVGKVSRGALRFARIQHRVPLYLESDGQALRHALHGRRPFVVAVQYSTEIVGRFFIGDRDVFPVAGVWPGNVGTFVPGSPVIVVGDAKLSSVKGITGNYFPTWWMGNVVLFEAQ